MTQRPYNFSAGPATLPEPVLQKAAEEMLDWHGSGMGVMEMSHRGKDFVSIYEQAESTLRELLAVPPNFRILFMQGGGLGENAIVPMNLSRGGLVDVIVSGSWSQKSLKEAQRYADAKAAASNEADGHTSLPAPSTWALRDGVSYVHVCSNETIHGVEMATLPDLTALGCEAPLVVDCSSHVLSRAIDWSRVGVAFAGAQKNIGPAGLTLVFVRDDLLDRALPICPSAFEYKTVATHQSMYNTPPTYGIYVAGLVFQWVKAQGGVAEMDRRAAEKAALLYGCLDNSGGFYRNKVDRNGRSRMNVPFFLADESLNDAFLTGAREAGLLQLKGHKSVGGMRASLYNAMSLAGVQALVGYMQDFARRHG
jgi:phosphoserine aminotransferase